MGLTLGTLDHRTEYLIKTQYVNVCSPYSETNLAIVGVTELVGQS